MTSFRSVVLLTVTIEPLTLQMVYDSASNCGLALFDLLCFTSAPFSVGVNFHACFGVPILLLDPSGSDDSWVKVGNLVC